jgi:hypothetical protein
MLPVRGLAFESNNLMNCDYTVYCFQVFGHAVFGVFRLLGNSKLCVDEWFYYVSADIDRGTATVLLKSESERALQLLFSPIFPFFSLRSAKMSVFGNSTSSAAAGAVSYRSYKETTAAVLDPAMGRCLVATANFQPGDVIFTERAFMYSTYDGKNPFEADLIRHSFPRIIVDRLVEITDDLSNLDRVQSLDTAKNFLLLVAIQKLRVIGASDKIMKYFSHFNFSAEEVSEKLQLFDQLSGANLAECVTAVRSIQQDYPKLISAEVSTEQAARLLSIVTTNQLELEELGGSGLFVQTAILQHDCSPNCSYSTDGTDLYLAAIAPITVGQRLSIDYINGFYKPTPERQEALQETYGFRCCCSACSGPDRKRAYCCECCPGGAFYAVGNLSLEDSINTAEPMGAGPLSHSNCEQCKAWPSLAHLQRCIAQEQNLLATPPASLQQYEQSCADKLCHRTHYVYFTALEELSLKLSDEARSNFFDTFGSGIGTSRGLALFGEALTTLRVCIQLLEYQLPPVHHEKVVFYDRLGQLAVAVGDQGLAHEAYGSALRQSELSCGPHVPATAAVRALAMQPPATLAELLEHYQSREPTAAEDWEDMEDGDN